MTVTEILKRVGLINAEWFTEHGAARGTAVHKAVELDVAGTLDESSIHPEVAPYFDAWRKADLYGMGFKILSMEIEVEGKGYTGHPDIIAERDGTSWVIDLKTGQHAAWHRLQTALYAEAHMPAPSWGAPRMRRAGLYLRRDESFRFVEFADDRDYPAARAAVTLANWMEQNV